VALDAATSPRSRARELRRSWEQFVGEQTPERVREPIAASWARSREAGVDPFVGRVAPVAAEPDEAAERWEGHPLAAAAPIIRECLGGISDEAEHLIVVSDAAGVLLSIEGNARVRLMASDTINFTEGASWSEAGAGTNAIGTALAAEHAVQVFAAEHFNEVVQAWTCAAAPIRDPDTRRVLGVVDLTGKMTTAHPHSFTCAVATAKAVESRLLAVLHERDGRLRSRYAERLSGAGRRALVTASGRVLSEQPRGWLGTERVVVPQGGGELLLPSGVVAFAEPVGREQAYVLRAPQLDLAVRRRSSLALRLLGDRAAVELDGRAVKLGARHAEILALLAARPAGITSDQLAEELYGDPRHRDRARVEVSRVRKLLGGAIDTGRYRLSIDVESDVARVRELLGRGEVREAAERYAGPLLPRSKAPGVNRERAQLESWLRHAVMSADDCDALWAWVRSPSGAADVPAWKRLLAALDFHDPRRSRAAAELQALRSAERPPVLTHLS
jgi:transcriptional regulator of acetoin/glycerol metabolism